MTRLGLLLCVFIGAAGSLGACHYEYSEEERWRACCAMSIAKVESSNAASAGTIIHLLSTTGFAADTGKPMRPMNDKSPAFGGIMQDILTAMNRFLVDHPKDRPSDYFRGLGMICKPAPAGTVDMVRCEIELPIQVTCSTMGMWRPPLPEGLPRTIPAQLYWQVDVSQSALLATDARVRPMPGGRLCHR